VEIGSGAWRRLRREIGGNDERMSEGFEEDEQKFYIYL
jgi:hypothetical protein